MSIEKNKKPKILLHYVKMGQLGGPNVVYDRIRKNDFLSSKYDFFCLNQEYSAGGKINIKLILSLSRKIREIKPDIIQVSGMQSTGFHCTLAAVFAGVKNRVITTHGFAAESTEIGPIKKFLFNIIFEPISIILSKKVHCISLYTQNKKMVKLLARKKSRVIYNFPPLVNDQVVNISRESFGFTKDDVIFITASRIVYDKGYSYLIEAINRFNNVRNIKFIIVGDGDYYETLSNKLNDQILSKQVVLMGRRDDVQQLMEISDVFLLPTIHEALGNVFIEASFAKIPSIGTNVGGVSEIIQDKITGLLIPPRDSNSIESAIKTLFISRELRKELGINAYKKAIDKFSHISIENEFDKLYQQLIFK